MSNFSKFKTYLSSSVGVAAGAFVGGLSVYYTIDRFYGIPPSKWDMNWDKRDAESMVMPNLNETNIKKEKRKFEVARHKSKATRHVILIRHGQYNLDGKTDVERVLTPLGEKQALCTGERLKALNFPYTSITHSTMTRAAQTSKLIQKLLPADIPVKTCQMLEEGAPAFPEPPHSWKPEYYVFRDGARIEAAFRKYIHRAPADQLKDSYEVIVCHGNVIRYFVCRALQLPPNAWLRFSINHASITWLSIHPNGKVALRQYSDVGHMPLEYITTS